MNTIARTALAATLVSLAFAGSPALADTTTAMGDRSGEGLTPFTGLSQAPDANLSTGASTTSIPIQVPPGRKSMTPDLALRYSSSGGPSPFGFGWDLPLGRIERSTKWGTPRCSPPHDQFFLILPGGVVELSNDPPGSNDYRPIVEESYLLARKFPAENRWEVYDRSGMRYVFGDSPAARAWTGADVFMRQWGSACQYTGSWALTRVVDANGNHMDITYVNAENVLYPITIEYGGNINNGLAHLYRITLQYEFRSDLDLIRYLGGVRTRLYLRLQQVRVGVLSGTTVNDFRTYTFSYDQQPGGPNGYQTILNHVQATGYPQETFTYSESVRGFAAKSFQPPSGIEHLRIRNSSGEVKQTLLDMNGDGFVDLVSRPGAGSVAPWTVYRGGPNGFVDQPINWSTPSLSDNHIRNVWVRTSPCSEGSGLACTVRDTFDLNGDGIPDYVVADSDAAVPICTTSTGSRPAWKVYLGTPFNQNGNGGGFSNTAIHWCAPSRFVRQDHSEQRRNAGSEWVLTRTIRDTIDMDGDGRPDLVVANSTNWQVYLNTGTGFAPNPVTYPAPVTSLTEIGAPGGSRTAHMMVDFNGDGLPDLVQRPTTFDDTWYDPACGGTPTQLLQ